MLWELCFEHCRAAQHVLGLQGGTACFGSCFGKLQTGTACFESILEGFGVCAALGFSRGPGGATGVLDLKYTYEEISLGFRV